MKTVTRRVHRVQWARRFCTLKPSETYADDEIIPATLMADEHKAAFVEECARQDATVVPKATKRGRSLRSRDDRDQSLPSWNGAEDKMTPEQWHATFSQMKEKHLYLKQGGLGE